MSNYAERRRKLSTNVIVRVHRPDITDEERNRRMKQIYIAAENVLKAKEKRNGKV